MVKEEITKPYQIPSHREISLYRKLPITIGSFNE